MVWTIYIIIFSYFVLGGIGFFFINRRKNADEANKSWTKFITYFFIIHILFFSIVLDPLAFRFLSVFIIAVGFYELTQLFRKSGCFGKTFFIFSIIIFFIFSFGLFLFSGMDKGLILFTFLVLSIFDSFSQISGQLFGRKKLLPKISPQKTLEGLIGGAITAVLSALLLESLINLPTFGVLELTCGVVVFAFTGDILSSFYKRKYNVKDFSKLIPGHGGVLDRFDSMISGGALVGFTGFLTNL